MDAVGAQQQAIAGTHRHGEHVDARHVVLQTDERGQAVEGHAPLTVLGEVEPGGEQLGAHVVVVGEQVELLTGQAVRARVADVDHGERRAGDERRQQRGADVLEAPADSLPHDRRR